MTTAGARYSYSRNGEYSQKLIIIVDVLTMHCLSSEERLLYRIHVLIIDSSNPENFVPHSTYDCTPFLASDTGGDDDPDEDSTQYSMQVYGRFVAVNFTEEWQNELYCELYVWDWVTRSRVLVSRFVVQAGAG